MLTVPAPSNLNGRQLRAELAAAGVTVDAGAMSVVGAELLLDIAASSEAAARQVIAAHAGTADLEVVNTATIEQRLAADLVIVDEITAAPAAAFTQAGVRDLQRQVKDMARMNKRLIRLALRRVESAE